MRLLFVGTPKVAADTLRQLLTGENFALHDIAGVLTREDAPVGRKRVITPSPVAQLADEYGIPVIKANKVTSDVLLKISEVNVDAAVVVAYGALLGPEALDSLPKGWYNLHYSLLPKYRGAAPVQWALINGEKETGVTLFQLDAGMDTGPILGSAGCIIEPRDNAASLLGKLSTLGISVLAEALPMIESGIMPLRQQRDADATFAPKLKRSDAEIDWTKSASEIENLIRGTNPEPGAFSTVDSGPVKVLEAWAVENAVAEASRIPSLPGAITREGKSVVVECGRGHLRLERVQPAGKGEMPASDWYSGIANRSSEEFDQLRFEVRAGA